MALLQKFIKIQFHPKSTKNPAKTPVIFRINFALQKESFTNSQRVKKWSFSIPSTILALFLPPLHKIVASRALFRSLLRSFSVNDGI
jgi:hypothetical protein